MIIRESKLRLRTIRLIRSRENMEKMKKQASQTPSLLEIYFNEFGTLARDPLCPEIRAWNTGNLHDLWVIAGRMDSRAPVPFWAIVWPGARALARYILDNKKDFKGLRVLDAGTGSGIAAVAAAKAGARATGMDVDPLAVEMAERTARANRVRCEFIRGDAVDLDDDALSEYDMVIAGDVFYEERFAGQAIRLLRSAARLGLKNLAADVGRTFRPQTGFKLIRTMRIPVFREIEGIEYRDTNIISLEKE